MHPVGRDGEQTRRSRKWRGASTSDRRRAPCLPALPTRNPLPSARVSETPLPGPLSVTSSEGLLDGTIVAILTFGPSPPPVAPSAHPPFSLSVFVPSLDLV